MKPYRSFTPCLLTLSSGVAISHNQVSIAVPRFNALLLRRKGPGTRRTWLLRMVWYKNN